MEKRGVGKNTSISLFLLPSFNLLWWLLLSKPKQNPGDTRVLGYRVGPRWAKNGLRRGIQADNIQHAVKCVNGIKIVRIGTSPDVQWLRLCFSNAGDTSLIPGWESRILNAVEQLSLTYWACLPLLERRFCIAVKILHVIAKTWHSWKQRNKQIHINKKEMDNLVGVERFYQDKLLSYSGAYDW